MIALILFLISAWFFIYYIKYYLAEDEYPAEKVIVSIYAISFLCINIIFVTWLFNTFEKIQEYKDSEMIDFVCNYKKLYNFLDSKLIWQKSNIRKIFLLFEIFFFTPVLIIINSCASVVVYFCFFITYFIHITGIFMELCVIVSFFLTKILVDWLFY